MKCLVAGEGPTEIGDFARDPAYRRDPPSDGVLQRVLANRLPGVRVVDGVLWKKIPKYRAGEHRAPEARNILGLALRATEAGCTHLVFARDRDGDSRRERDVEDGIARAGELFAGLSIAGGVAVETIESWILSMLGHPRAELLADPKAVLEEQHQLSSANQKCDVVDRADWSALPRVEAPSLQRWLARLAELPGHVSGTGS